ncbi:c-type cytochrome [Roseibium aggregatum]|uniref:C-type cytochrome n=1 Tax=Roseibium aggregatum TaxID=187304 RepID=A0A926SAC8_9HYPH|nr:c-type cytochrome [Roseibium aggregatum]MBD1548784.1 c-type cytochrome [Roseibium aggregatum]
MKPVTITALASVLTLLAAVPTAYATMHGDETAMSPRRMVSPGLMMPQMDPARGRVLFASKGCVVCHSINGVGGEDAPALDADTMPLPMNPFEFSAKMWLGAEAMVAMQREELGAPIELSGQELADIIAFVHDAPEQKTFSVSDIPDSIKDLMEHDEEGGDESHEGEAGKN